MFSFLRFETSLTDFQLTEFRFSENSGFSQKHLLISSLREVSKRIRIETSSSIRSVEKHVNFSRSMSVHGCEDATQIEDVFEATEYAKLSISVAQFPSTQSGPIVVFSSVASNARPCSLARRSRRRVHFKGGFRLSAQRCRYVN